MQSLFGHLVTKFGERPEDLATESLSYILNRSSIAGQAFLEHIAQTSIRFPTDLHFKTQVEQSDGLKPDLVGIDSEGQQVLIVESKFWAGLTGSQPVGYLDHLPAQKGGLLLFIAPSRRFQTLWPELLKRCKDNGLNIPPDSQSQNELRVASISDNRCLALASWRSVLDFILRAVESRGETELASDVTQLKGLCQYMDTEAFLPFRSEELASSIGTRVYQYCQLASDLTERLKSEGLASVEGFRAAGGFGYYGNYMWIRGCVMLLKFDAELWSKYRETPLWLTIKGPDWEYPQIARERLSHLETEEPPRMLRTETELLVPLNLPVGEERDVVVDSLLSQIREIAGLLEQE